MKLLAAILFCLFNRAPAPVSVHRVVVAPAETLSVTATGAGTPVVVIPGMLGGSFGFRKVTAELNAQGDRVIIIDPLGTGGSSRPDKANYSMEAQAARVAAAMDSLQIGRALVVGHAAGAPIALRLALLRPELVSGIVSVNGSASEHFSSGRMRMALRLAPVLKLFGGQQRAQQHVVNGLRESSADAAWVTDDVVAEYTAPYKTDFNGTLRVLKAVAFSKEPWPLLPRLQQLHVPVVLVLGTGSAKPAVKPDEVEAMRAALPTLRIDSVANAGAFVQEEQPDLLVRAIRALR
ncbi:MAG TPA: alpha/beta fold hydrolase [Longimicrobiales bacterium]